MKLSTKVHALYWTITILFAAPAVILSFMSLVAYHLPPKKIFRDGLGEMILGLVAKMIDWRYKKVKQFYKKRANYK